MAVALTVAGPMTLSRGGVRLDDDAFGGRQQRLVTAMLLVDRRSPTTVERLALEVWPTGPPNTWRSALRTLVSRLRGHLLLLGAPQEVLVHRAGRYVVDLPGLVVDVEEAAAATTAATRHARAGHLDLAAEQAEHALDVLRLPTLPGVDAAWADRLRDRLHDHHVDALLAAAAAARHRHDWAIARPRARRALELSPLREAGWRELMRIEAAAGNAAAASDVYHQCRTLLRDELGTDPDDRTRELHDDLLGHTPHTDHRARDQTETRSHTGATGGLATPGDNHRRDGFVGRGRLLADLVGRLGRGDSVVLQGPAGIGKTRLVAEVLAASGGPDHPVDRLLASRGTADRNLGTLAAVAGGAPREASPVPELYGWFLNRWRSDNGDRPPIVWLDDAQHVDELSAAILRHATTVGAIQLVATHRTPEPLGEDLTALRTEGVLTTLAIPPLPDDDARELARHHGAAALPATELGQLVGLAAGNPLFLRELARSVRPGDRRVHLDSLGELVGRPLMRLARSRRRTAELIALAEPVPAAVLVERADDLGVLFRRGLVRRHGDGDLRIDHPLRSAWLVDRLGPAPTDAWGALVDLAVTAGSAADLDPVTLVDWELRAGRDPDPGRAVEAARLAVARSDGPTAARLVDAVAGPDRDLLRAQGLVLGGALDRGLDLLERVRRTGAAAQRVEAASWLARYVGVMGADFRRAHRLLSDTDDPDLSPRHRRQLLMGRLWLWIYGPIREPIDLAQIDRIANIAPLEPVCHQLLVGRLAVSYLDSSPWSARPVVDRLLQLEDELDVTLVARTRARATMCAFWMFAGDLGRAHAVAREHARQAMRERLPEAVTLIAGVGCLVTALNGHVREAIAMGRAAEPFRSGTDWFNQGVMAHAVLLGNLAYAEDPDEARRELASWEHGVDPSFDLIDLFQARAETLADGAAGRSRDDGRLLRALGRMAAHGKRTNGSWLAAEVTDRRTSRAIHRMVAGSTDHVTGPGLARLAGTAANARLDHDVQRLAEIALDYERSGFPAAAMRTHADVVALADDPELARRGRVGIVRSLRSWDGARPWWLRDLAGLPTLELVRSGWGRSAATDASAQTDHTARAARVEVAGMLGVRDPDVLEEILRPGPGPHDRPPAA